MGYIEVAKLGKEDVVIYDVKSLTEGYKQSAYRASVDCRRGFPSTYAVLRLAHEWWTCLDAAELVSVQKWIRSGSSDGISQSLTMPSRTLPTVGKREIGRRSSCIEVGGCHATVTL